MGLLELDNMISKARIKLVNSLLLKKNRKAENLFLVEGSKNVLELLNSDFEILSIYGTPSFYSTNKGNLTKFKGEFCEVDESTLSKIGSFVSNNAAMALVQTKPNIPLELEESDISLVLDGVKDPGNLGTILRISDWYGIRNLVLSSDSVDIYNPKVISASMGSFTRINCWYTDLVTFLQNQKIQKVGAFLSGAKLSDLSLNKRGYIVVMGSESHGISKEVEELIDMKVTIQRYGQAESLNVGIATAVLLDNFRRLLS